MFFSAWKPQPHKLSFLSLLNHYGILFWDVSAFFFLFYISLMAFFLNTGSFSCTNSEIPDCIQPRLMWMFFRIFIRNFATWLKWQAAKKVSNLTIRSAKWISLVALCQINALNSSFCFWVPPWEQLVRRDSVLKVVKTGRMAFVNAVGSEWSYA